MPPSREKTVTVSLRISETAFKAIHGDAKKLNLSFNTLANQIFHTYSDYDRFMMKFRMVKIALPTLKRIFDAATEEEIARAGEAAGGNIPESVILAMKGELSVDNALGYLQAMGTYSNMFDYSEIVRGEGVSITLAHEFGSKGSLFLSSYVESMFSLLGKQVKAVQFQDSVSLEI